MRLSTLASLGLATLVTADFYLYGEVVSDVEGVEKPRVRIVDAADRGDCDPMSEATKANGADGNNFFPYPEEEFKTENDGICGGTMLRFIKDGDNFKVVYDESGEDAGYCTRGEDKDTQFCTWGLVSAEYVEDYFCKSSVCA